MRKRKLGRTGYEVSTLGFGTLGLGGDMWRDVTPLAAQRTLYMSVEQGVDFIDTALSYAGGEAETLVGEVIRDLRARDHVVVATKVPPMNDTWPATPDVPLERVFHPQHVQRSVEQSLRNLRAEVLCIEQFHVWHDAWLSSSMWPEVRGCMQRMVKQGKVLHWGVSINSCDPDSAMNVLDEPLIETAQVVYNIFDRSAERGFLAKARERDIGLIARSPLDESGLSGALTVDTTFPRGDFRGRYFAGERLAAVVERADALEGLCGDEVATVPELALRFVVSHPDIGVVIPGMRTAAHLRDNLASVTAGPLSSAMLARLREHAWDKNWYTSATARAS